LAIFRYTYIVALIFRKVNGSMTLSELPRYQGYLMPIGGAEDKKAQRTILKHFIQLAGGANARIAVIPTASESPEERGAQYCTLFSSLGAEQVDCIHLRNRHDANSFDTARRLDNVTGVFMTGGDQVKLVSLIGGTLLARKLLTRFWNGVTVAGTSAGASAMSLHMIAFGRSGAKPSQRMVQLAPGLGLAPDLIIDQHFSQRDRTGRLMTAVAFNPALIGVGVDEDTALVIAPDGQCEVIGSGSVTVVDGRNMEYTDIHSVKRYNPITVLGMRVETFTAGTTLKSLMLEDGLVRQAV
jgi:cyanophycinase